LHNPERKKVRARVEVRDGVVVRVKVGAVVVRAAGLVEMLLMKVEADGVARGRAAEKVAGKEAHGCQIR